MYMHVKRVQVALITLPGRIHACPIRMHAKEEQLGRTQRAFGAAVPPRQWEEGVRDTSGLVGPDAARRCEGGCWAVGGKVPSMAARWGQPAAPR